MGIAQKVSVLLVEDDEVTNYINKRIIETNNTTELAGIAETGREALEFLHDTIHSKGKLPDIIFLDIRMPDLNGWDFYEEFKNWDSKTRSDIFLVMLTGSVNPEDERRAKNEKNINAYLRKPLSGNMLNQVLRMRQA